MSSCEREKDVVKQRVHVHRAYMYLLATCNLRSGSAIWLPLPVGCVLVLLERLPPPPLPPLPPPPPLAPSTTSASLVQARA